MTWLKSLAEAIARRCQAWFLQLPRHVKTGGGSATATVAPPSMPHLYNRNAFRTRVANPLFDLYCSLVVLELSLKDKMNVWRGGHDVADFVSGAGEAAL